MPHIIKSFGDAIIIYTEEKGSNGCADQLTYWDGNMVWAHQKRGKEIINVILRDYYGVYEGASKELTHPHS